MYQWLRRLTAAGLLVTPWAVRFLMGKGSHGDVYFLLTLLGCSALAAGFLLPDLMRPLGMVVDTVFGTGIGSRGKPPLDYRLARHYLQKGRLEEALGEYRRIMKHYPGEVEPYLESMVLTAQLEGNRRLVNRYLSRGLKNAERDQEKQGHLRTTWQQAQAILKGME